MESGLQHEVKLIVGLGNPGAKYALTRHNIGVWFIKAMLNGSLEELRPAKVAKAKITPWQDGCHLMVPDVYMNLSGKEIGRYMRYFNILPENLLVVHDELDFPPGTVRLKLGGGCAGHNGLRGIKENLQSSNFMRLRLGVGRPQHPEEVKNYVMTVPPKAEFESILTAIDEGLAHIPTLLAGELHKAMQDLHSEPGDNSGI